MSVPADYLERTYAGVLGKIIGVYLGRPFEQWSHERIMAELGEITYYVHERMGMPLVVTDDDISGTFTFVRALPDYGNPRDLTAEQIGQTWLNYIVENRTILWWGGMGNSTEHTAYLRLKEGHRAPASGSARLNTRTVAEQIGAQIFVDSWAMVAPGDPDLAARLAQRAASVSHDGEAIYAAQVVAVMESLAYVEGDLSKLIDAASEACRLVSIGCALMGEDFAAPKAGARFHFELPGSVQGFMLECDGAMHAHIENVPGHSVLGTRSLAVRWERLAQGQALRLATATFIPPEVVQQFGYGLQASPSLYPGQTIRARLAADTTNPAPVVCRLCIQVYGAHDRLETREGAAFMISPGEASIQTWMLEDTGGAPIARVGVTIRAEANEGGAVYLDMLDWRGEPVVVFQRPAWEGTMWRRAWVNATEPSDAYGWEAFRLVHNRGTGMWLTGGREWANYSVSADITPHLISAAGIAARVQGLARYYAFLLCQGGRLRLIKALDGEQILAEAPYDWQPERAYPMQISVEGSRIVCRIDGQAIFSVDDDERPLMAGGIALVCADGRMATERVDVAAAAHSSPRG